MDAERDLVARVATAIVGSGGQAEDVVQEAFIKSFTRLDQFDADRSFKAWLLAIVTNEARNRRRGDGRRDALTLRGPGTDALAWREDGTVAVGHREVASGRSVTATLDPAAIWAGPPQPHYHAGVAA